MRKFLLIFLSIFVLTGCEIEDSTNSDLDSNDTESNGTDNDSNDTEEQIYFEALNLEYTGPSIDSDYYNINNLYQEVNGELYGTGHLFEVTLNRNVDGDTAHFNVPNEYKNIYTSSFRFLNMDTEETYGTAEEWGKPASVYTAGLLSNAHSIILQTDNGYNITDAYNRGLTWIWIQENENDDYILLNYKVVQQGLATVKYTYDGSKLNYNNINYTNWMYTAQNEAKSNKRGMHSDLLDPYWNYENGTLYTSLVN